MRITIDKRRTWIPDFKENNELPENEKICVSYDKPAAYKRDEWTRVIATRDSAGKLSTYIDKDTRKIILDSDVEIENLIVVEDGKEKQITTGKDLLETRSDLCSLLCIWLVNQILKEDYKAELPN